MTIYTVTALAAFLSAHNCVPPKAVDVMVGVAMTESGGNSLSIHDNTGAVSFTPSTKAEAIKLANALLAIHHDLDLGAGNVNVRNFGWTHLTVETAFDECRNMDAATRIMFVRYNGNPPDASKIVYAQRVMARITDDGNPKPTEPAIHPPDAPAVVFVRPAHAGRDLVYSQ